MRTKMKQVLVSVLVGYASFAGSSMADEVPSVDASPKLSDLLPDAVAEFVRQAGTDRPVSVLSEQQLALLENPEVDLAGFLDLLQPESGIRLDAPVTILRTATPRDQNDSSMPSQTRLVAGSNLILVDEVELAVGESLAVGDEVHEGIVLNLGDTTIVLLDGSGIERTLKPQRAFLAPLRPCAHSCEVDCAGSYFACCRISENNCYSCNCVPNGNSGNSCNGGGGPGATRCASAQ